MSRVSLAIRRAVILVLLLPWSTCEGLGGGGRDIEDGVGMLSVLISAI